ncbi:MAG: DNA polymerase/3'-5' exonuclease PolX [Chloroflexi bacterium]|nr:DNA polymerase/3'-5' exonuclease PolX [Chloroflexota bacterium]
MQFTNQQVALVFRDIADSMDVLGENRFKTQAYARAAETIEELPTSLYDHLAAGTLDDLPGVGSAITAKITELLNTGSLGFRERLREQVPDGVLQIMRVPGVGPKTALRLYRELAITDVEALESAVRAGELRKVKGFGPKLETKILEGLAAQAAAPDRFLLGEMLPLALDLVTGLRAAYPQLAEASHAGSLRRAAPTIGDLDLVAAAAQPEAVLKAFAELPLIAQVEHMSEQRIDARLHNGKSCSLLVVPPEIWGAALALWTGSAAHRSRLMTLAADRGLVLEERGLRRGDDLMRTPTEEALYEALGLAWIPPELREDWGEIEAAQTGKLPRLVELSQIRADMHTHSEWSDGRGTVAEVAAAARARGYEYYVISDHSFYMGMVNGLDAERLKQQRAEIDAVNEEMQRQGINFKLLQGSEVDILPDGSLALPDDVLATLDWVVASLHVSLRQDRDTVTKRLLNAIRNPHVDCIGHPTGRLLLRRQGADLDMDAVLEAAAEAGKVLEIDGSYPRLDLDAEHAKRAIAMGIPIAVDSDAHRPGELGGIEYGVLTARRAWARAEDIVNCHPWEEVVARFRR